MSLEALKKNYKYKVNKAWIDKLGNPEIVSKETTKGEVALWNVFIKMLL